MNCGYRETRVAVMENKKLVDLFIETSEGQKVVGNIYKAKVSDVLPGMQLPLLILERRKMPTCM